MEGRVQGNKPVNTYCVPDSELELMTIIDILGTHSKSKVLYTIISRNPCTNPMKQIPLFAQFFREGNSVNNAQSPTARKWLSPGSNPGLSGSKISVNHYDSASLL